MRLRTGYIYLNVVGVPTDWFQVVLTHQDQTLVAYHNKIVQTGSQVSGTTNLQSESGTAVIGKSYVDVDNYYSSVIVDELAMWNHARSPAEVAQMYDLFSG